MKKVWLPLTVALLMLITACGNGKSGSKPNGAKSETFTYESQNGPVEVPADPKRVVVLSSFAGNVMALGVNLVGVDSWSKMNPQFESKLKDVAEVSDENIEKIIELNPDLIIGLDNVKNVDKLKRIAPTVVYTYGKVDYLTQQIEIGKLLNKEKEARAWVDDFRSRAGKAGDEIRAKIGEDATVSVVESFEKQLYVYGDHWARGTEILYQEMKLKMPEKVKEMVEKDGYYALSSEVLPEYAGDYLIVCKNPDADNSFMSTETYKNIPAVKNNRVFEVNAKAFYFNDPLTLEYQLEVLTDKFLGKAS
ncbi:iron-hydroxamate ABC transporter substrate-binding protein [Cohnella caldifontis]|uniref:iron-hydroxamate ABC transporter substrate-binding protein n=1 Tax=Cohnella caldifontis TaxID=3027471 RepID=UPI0023ED5AEC|nr:iron-hydroxamate ABC transporter substrate-binding protein [Cohnella sp. YIM B05605]